MTEQDNLMPEIDRLRQENEQWEKSFALYWKANQRGTEMWRAANPGNNLVLPDTGKMVEWLIGELHKSRLEIARLKSDNRDMRDELAGYNER